MSTETQRRLLSGRAIWAEVCDCGEECWSDHEAWLVQVEAPDGQVYVGEGPGVSFIIRADVVDLGDLDTWGWWFNERPAPRAMDWHGLRPVAKPSSALFNRRLIEILLAQGCSVLPLERDLRLNHHQEGVTATPPHALMWGEDHIGWIVPAIPERIKNPADFVQAVTLR